MWVQLFEHATVTTLWVVQNITDGFVDTKNTQKYKHGEINEC